MATAILVSNDEATRRSAGKYLEDASFRVEYAGDVLTTLRQLFALRPDAVVVDSQVSKAGGVEITAVLRAISDDVAIVVISGSPDPDAIVRALDQGADDYITRPFSGTEFVVRIRAAVRRALRARKTPEQNLVVQTGDLVIDREARIVTKRGKVVHLTPTEFRLLEALSIRVGKVAPHRFLLSTVWGDEFVNDTHYLRIYVGYLRQKLEDDPSRPEYLLNEWGTGYRLAAFPAAATGALSGAASQRWEGPRPLAIDGSNHHHEEVDELPAIRTAGARWAG